MSIKETIDNIDKLDELIERSIENEYDGQETNIFNNASEELFSKSLKGIFNRLKPKLGKYEKKESFYCACSKKKRLDELNFAPENFLEYLHNNDFEFFY
jgi:hypothetical protein